MFAFQAHGSRLIGLLVGFSFCLSFQGCTAESSDTKAVKTDNYTVTNRMQPGDPGQMGPRDPVQCSSNNSRFSYTGDEEINGMPIAGVDNGTFGSSENGVVTDTCGTCAVIREQKFIVVDRIHQNPGAGNGGSNQIDVAGSVANKWNEEDEKIRAGGKWEHRVGTQEMHVEASGC